MSNAVLEMAAKKAQIALNQRKSLTPEAIEQYEAIVAEYENSNTPNQGKGVTPMSAKKAPKTTTKAPVTPAPAAAATTTTPAATPAATPTAPAAVVPATEKPKALPFGGKQAEPFKTLGERDVFGFGQETETSWLLARLSKGGITKANLLTEFLAKFVPNGEVAESKRKKTSFSVFFSDVKKPFGTYHASRSLEIVADAAGNLSLSADSVARCQKAIKAKVLDDLRGLTPKKHREKINVVLKKHNLPMLEESK